MLLAIDKYFNKLASQERSLRTKRRPLRYDAPEYDDHFNCDTSIESDNPNTIVRDGSWDGHRGSYSEVFPAPRKRRWLLIDEYFNDCLEKEAQSKHIPNHFHGKAFSDPKKRHRLLIDEYLDNRHEKTAQSKPIRSRSLPKNGSWLMLDEYFDNHLEKEAQSRRIHSRSLPKKNNWLMLDKYLENRLEKEAHPKLIRNRSLTKLQEAQMPRKKREPEVVREYADATPRRARVYVDGLSHALKDFAKANNLPVVEAISAKLKWFMRFEDSLENFFVHGIEDQHPDFNEFFSALIAQPHFRNLCGDEAASILKQEFTPKANPHMPNGYSCWASYNREPYPENPRRSVA